MPSASTSPTRCRRGRRTSSKLHARCEQLDAARVRRDPLQRAGHRPDRRAAARRALDRAAAARPAAASSTSPNLPTEEVFAVPRLAPDRGHGPLDAAAAARRHDRARPRDALRGRRRRRGAASAGADAVRGQMAIDEFANASARSRSSTATSRVGQTGITFFDTLFDENATCHIAYGAGRPLRHRRARRPRARPAARARHQRLGRPHRLHDRRPRGRGRRNHEGRRRRSDPAGGRVATV